MIHFIYLIFSTQPMPEKEEPKIYEIFDDEDEDKPLDNPDGLINSMTFKIRGAVN